MCVTIQKTEALVAPFSFMETTPLLWHGRPCLMTCVRPGRGGKLEEYYLVLVDMLTHERIATFATGYGLACAYVEDDTMYVYASLWDPGREWTDIYLLVSNDLINWTESLVITAAEGERLFNSSVCKDDTGYLMAYESNTYTPFTVKFARSNDLHCWEKLADHDYSRDRYAACPTVRWLNGYYYLIYLVAEAPGYVTHIARSRDLRTWERSPYNPMLSPSPGEGINNSDVDLFEYDGQVHIFYATGDQQTWGGLKRATFDGTLGEFLQSYFPI
jgi:hypothetical protein